MFLSIFDVGLLSISSFFSFQQDSKDLSREEKCLKYTKIVEESDYTKYDTVYFDYENGPTFLDTELDNITENEYKNRPDFSYHNEIKRENSTRDSSGLYPDSIRYLVSQSDCSTWASGSPIFKQNTLNVCGIHSAGIHENGIDVNTACRVSSYIESWVAGNIIDWAIDD